MADTTSVSFEGVTYAVPCQAIAERGFFSKLWYGLVDFVRGATSKPEEEGDIEAPAKSGEDQYQYILKGIDGIVKSGESLAILGPSGSGKTTFLNLISGRSQYDVASGSVLFNGAPRDARTKRSLGYVMQDDVFFSRLTVRETLNFTAAIRLSDALTSEEQAKIVDTVVSRLRLGKCQDIQIGDQLFHKGISGGERKRLNIANELLIGPKILLLDEPTSGLDASTAMIVIRLLRQLADEGNIIISTIHQPSSAMYGMFDKVMLLSEGEVAYFGPTMEAEKYFASIGFSFPRNYNPCDYMMELLIEGEIEAPAVDADRSGINPAERDVRTVNSKGAGSSSTEPGRARENGQASFKSSCSDTTGTESPETARQYLVRMWKQRGLKQFHPSASGETHAVVPASSNAFDSKRGYRDVARGMRRAVGKRARDITGKPDPTGLPEKYMTSWWTQVRVLGVRAMRQKRGAVVDRISIAQVISLTVIVVLFWFRTGYSEGELDDRIGALFFYNVFWSFFTMFTALFAFPPEKAVLNKDRASGAYRLSAYYFAKTMVETPADMLYPLAFSISAYWLTGMNENFVRFVIFTLILILIVIVSQSIGLALSAAVLDVRKAQVIAAVIVLGSMLIGGYYVDPENLPRFIKPLRYLSYIKYGFEALVRNDVLGQTYSCVANGQTHTVYSNNGKECPVTGRDVLRGAQIDDGLSIAGNVGVLILWIVLARVVGYYAMKYLHTPQKQRKRSK